MKFKKDPNKILNEVYSSSFIEINKDQGITFFNDLAEEQKEWLEYIVSKAESQKALITVLTTSLIKKIENPSQDIRYHQEGMPKGYSGRTLDTKFVTPFFKDKFPRIAMKESGWLTRSFEQPYPYTLKYRGKIQDKKAKKFFLNILYIAS